MSKKIFTFLILPLLILCSSITFANQAPTNQTPKTNQRTVINQIVAIVNNDVITANQLDEAVEQTKAQILDQGQTLPSDLTLKRQVLQQLINQTIILELAKRNHISATNSEVNKTISMIADQNHISIMQLKQKIKSSGLDYSEYYNAIKKQVIIQKMQQKLVVGSIFISPKDIDQYVEKNLNKPQTKRFDVSNILIPLPTDKTPDAINKAKASAEKLVTDIKANQISFRAAARKYSQSDNALSGGNLGSKTLEQLPSIYANKVTSMTKGQIIGPFEANDALQILKLNNIETQANQKHWAKQYHVQQILLKLTPILNAEDAKAQLERIIIALNNNQSFSSLAKANTQNYDVASKGGDLGWVSLNQVSPQLAQAIKQTPVNKVSKPFEVGNTWQIIKVLGTRKSDDTKNYLHMQAANILFRQKAEQMIKNWQLSLRGEAYVKILIPELNMPELSS